MNYDRMTSVSYEYVIWKKLYMWFLFINNINVGITKENRNRNISIYSNKQ